MRQPGKIVQTAGGHLGRTYNNEEPVRGKIKVHLFEPAEAEKLREIFNLPAVDPPDTLLRLCPPFSLKILGFAD